MKVIPIAGPLLHTNIASAELAACYETAERAQPYLIFKQPQVSVGELKLCDSTTHCSLRTRWNKW